MQEERTAELEVLSPSSMELIQRAEIDMQIATAKKYPRDLAKVKRRMLDFATLDEETAESCFYSVPRDGKTIQGPSVRLAEIAVACYQNLRAASRVIDNNGKIITSQAACHDLENNTLISVEVQRRITNKQGKVYSEDMQVTAGNAANSIAFRNAVFKVIPGALIKPVYEAAKAVAVGNASTLVVKRDKIIKKLNAMHVDTPRILAKLGKSSVENVGLEDLEALIGLGTAIKDGDTSVDESFPPIKVHANGETEQARTDRLDRQMDEQRDAAIRQENADAAGQQTNAQAETPAADTAATTEPDGSTKVGPWATRTAMLFDFKQVEAELGSDKMWGILGTRHSIESGDELIHTSDDTWAVYQDLKAEAEFVKPAQKEATPIATSKPKLTFGGKK